jgi:hypothetical protein
MTDESPDLFAALEQRGAELKSLAELFAGFRSELIINGFTTDVAELITVTFAEQFITNGFEIDDDEPDET